MRSNHQPAFGLVLIRIFAGLTVFVVGWGWWKDTGFDARAMEIVLREGIERRGTIGTWWGQEVLLVNPAAVLFLWKTMTLVAGTSFLLGALVRPVGALAAFFLFQAALYGPAGHGGHLTLLIACFVGCAIAHAGGGLGADLILDETLPSWMTWTQARRRSLF